MASFTPFVSNYQRLVCVAVCACMCLCQLLTNSISVDTQRSSSSSNSKCFKYKSCVFIVFGGWSVVTYVHIKSLNIFAFTICIHIIFAMYNHFIWFHLYAFKFTWQLLIHFHLIIFNKFDKFESFQHHFN